MKDYKDYYTTVIESSGTTGNKPSVYQYMVIRLCDNSLIVVLFFLLIFFTCLGIFVKDVSAWCLDAAKLCLGVFLGLFAAKKK